MPKVVTNHHRRTLVEFLQITQPKTAKLWGARSVAFSGVPQPWRWQESQECMWQMCLSMMVIPSFLTKEIPLKKRRLEWTTH